MLNLVREARDHLFAAATAGRKSVEVEGVQLTLRGASPRMRYVMSRGYEAGDALLAAKVLESTDKVLEAGSAVGFVSLYCRKTIGISDYCLVEANPDLTETIGENYRLNGLGSPLVIHAAVAAEDGPIEFGVHKNFWSSSTVERGSQTRVSVPGRSIPSLLAEIPFRPNTLIMDIEGGEQFIPLEHFDLFDKVIIETHRKLVGDGPIDRLLIGMRQMGFNEAGRDSASFAFVRGAAN